jgi:hypothetical protein
MEYTFKRIMNSLIPTFWKISLFVIGVRFWLKLSAAFEPTKWIKNLKINRTWNLKNWTLKTKSHIIDYCLLGMGIFLYFYIIYFHTNHKSNTCFTSYTECKKDKTKLVKKITTKDKNCKNWSQSLRKKRDLLI